jgi:ornithine--oxo-acid transaminase
MLRDKLEDLRKKYPVIKQVRGKGLMNAIEIDETYKMPADGICHKLLKNGLLAKTTHGNIIRLSPPLVIKEKQINEAVEIIEKSLK